MVVCCLDDLKYLVWDRHLLFIDNLKYLVWDRCLLFRRSKVFGLGQVFVAKDLVTRTLLKWWLSVYTVTYNHFLYNHFRNVSAMQQYNLKKIFFLKLQHKQLPQVKYFRSSKQQTTVSDQIL
jgi:hypothetical protein